MPIYEVEYGDRDREGDRLRGGRFPASCMTRSILRRAGDREAEVLR
jgi:hypothetical protein